MIGNLFQVTKVRVIESDHGQDVLVPMGTVVKTVMLPEGEQQIPDIAKYEVVEVAFPDEETKRQYGLDALGVAQGKMAVVSLGKEFVAALPERMMSLGILKSLPASSQSQQQY